VNEAAITISASIAASSVRCCRMATHSADHPPCRRTSCQQRSDTGAHRPSSRTQASARASCAPRRQKTPHRVRRNGGAARPAQQSGTRACFEFACLVWSPLRPAFGCTWIKPAPSRFARVCAWTCKTPLNRAGTTSRRHHLNARRPPRWCCSIGRRRIISGLAQNRGQSCGLSG
jgi:hypothetical protein